jgi:signal transduction histidine kinase
VRAARSDDEVVVSVTDQGVGIPADEQERIFDRFYRSAASEGVPRGGGIGLTIARRFTELHGGRIWVDSTPGRGSTFSFSIPATELVADDVGAAP